MTYAIIETTVRTTFYFNVVGKAEKVGPFFDIEVRIISLYHNKEEALVAHALYIDTSSERVNFPLGDDDDERHSGTASTERVRYEVSLVAPNNPNDPRDTFLCLEVAL